MFEDRGVRGTDVLFINPAVTSDQECDGQTENATIRFADLRVAHHDRIVHVHLLIKRTHGIGTVVHRDADDLQALAAVLLLHLDEVGNFFAAWHAPCRPEIQQHDLASIRRKAELLSIRLRESEIRGECASCRAVATLSASLVKHPDNDHYERGNQNPFRNRSQSYSPRAVG